MILHLTSNKELQTKNKVVLYKKHQLGDRLIRALAKAYCTVFNKSHFMIHKQSTHIIGLKTVFGSENVSYESMYSHPLTEAFRNNGYRFFHDPETVLKRLRNKLLSPNNKPYVSLLLDDCENVLGFNFGVVYPCLLELMDQEGWLNRYYYSNEPLFNGVTAVKKQARLAEKLLQSIRRAIEDQKINQPTKQSINQIYSGCHFFSPNALGVLPEMQGKGVSSLLNHSLFNSLEAEDRMLPFLFETTVGDKTHRVLKQIGCLVTDGTLANPDQKIQGNGDSVIMVGNHPMMIDGFLPLLRTA